VKRSCQPEILDLLPPEHPDAVHNRRDLRVINAIMRNASWFRTELRAHLRQGERVLELGAGTGEIAMGLNALGVPVDGLDLWPRPSLWPSGRRWHRMDLRSFEGYADYPVIMGNLIFHQFSEGELAALGERLRAGARVILACEPERRKLSQVIFGVAGPLLGANHVTLHDGHVSVRAGFRSDELPRALGLSGGGWRCACASTLIGVNRMVAVRDP
jgi:hypothetical protein